MPSCRFFLCASARGQADLSFSGANGTPFTLTLAPPVIYTVNTTAAAAPIFVFQGVGDIFTDGSSVTGNMTFTINGGSPISIARLGDGVPFGAISRNDIFITASGFPGVVAGDVVTLNAGSLTTANSETENFSPANGIYNTFLTDTNGIAISNSAIAVPEQGASLLGVLGSAGLVFRARNRRAR